MNRLILGAPGSGKSYLAGYCKSQGLPAYDADYDIPGLARWTDGTGNEAVFPETPSVQWLETHYFRWNQQVLEEFLRLHQNVWIFGIAENAFVVSPLFERSFYLEVTESVLRERLLSAGRTNQRGKTEAEVKQIWHDIQADHLPAVTKFGIKRIDGSLEPKEIVEMIGE